jgi:hypothetical protein
MKTNFTLNLKKAIFTTIVTFASFSAFSFTDISTTPNAGGLTVAIINNSVVMNWSNTNANYYEIQASTDGKSFSTIGMVIGADPKGDGTTFSFKQQIAKLKPGKPYYRVVLVNADNTASATTAVKAAN